MSKIQVDTIDTRSGTSTMQIGSTNTSTITLGVSGDTINVPSGVTIANAGTATGFGSEFANVQYSAAGMQTAAASVAHNTWTKFTMSSGSEQWDKGSILDLSNAKITVPAGAGGIWMFKAAAKNQTYSADRMLVRLYKNGSDTESLGGAQEICDLNTSQYPTNQLVHFLNLAASDYIEPYAYQNSGSGQNMYDFYFSGTYLGTAS